MHTHTHAPLLTQQVDVGRGTGCGAGNCGLFSCVPRVADAAAAAAADGADDVGPIDVADALFSYWFRRREGGAAVVEQQQPRVGNYLDSVRNDHEFR